MKAFTPYLGHLASQEMSGTTQYFLPPFSKRSAQGDASELPSLFARCLSSPRGNTEVKLTLNGISGPQLFSLPWSNAWLESSYGAGSESASALAPPCTCTIRTHVRLSPALSPFNWQIDRTGWTLRTSVSGWSCFCSGFFSSHPPLCPPTRTPSILHRWPGVPD